MKLFSFYIYKNIYKGVWRRVPTLLQGKYTLLRKRGSVLAQLDCKLFHGRIVQVKSNGVGLRPLEVLQVNEKLNWQNWGPHSPRLFVRLDPVPGRESARRRVDLGHEPRQVEVLAGDEEFVEVDQRGVLEPVHGAVRAVVERREEALGANVALRAQRQIPRQQRDQVLVGVVSQHPGHRVADRLVVEDEVVGAQQLVHLDELDEPERAVVAEVQRLHAHRQKWGGRVLRAWRRVVHGQRSESTICAPRCEHRFVHP